MTGRRCAVLGRPIAHSLSPAMHRAAYAHLGLDWTYDAYDVGEDELAEFVGELDERWRGLSLTMPLKRVALTLVDEVSEHARLVGAANTIVFDRGRRTGDNTDVPGMVAALAERGVREVRAATIVGAGATAASTVAALRGLGLESVTLLVRDPGKAASLAASVRDWGVEASVQSIDADSIDDTDLLVSTVPSAAVAGRVDDWCARAGAVFDVIYDPWPTPLANAATRAGLPAVSGLDLLAHQAALQIELMTGERIDADRLRDAALAELRSR